MNAEALLERVPDLGAKAVADHHAHAVIPIARIRGLVQQVAAQLTDVDKGRGATGADVAPEAGRAELARHGERGTGGEHRTPAHRERVVVVKRQRTVEDVVGAQTHRRLPHAVAAAQPAQVCHHQSLGQAGGARGEDKAERIARAYRGCQRRVAGAGLCAGRGQAEQSRGRRPVAAPQPGRVLRWFAGAGQCGQARITDHDASGFDEAQAVGQHLAALVRVEQAGHGPELGHRRHTGQQRRAVVEQQAHRVAAVHALGTQHVRDAVGPGVEVAVVPALAFEHHTVVAGDAAGLVFEHRRHRLGAVRPERINLQGRTQRFQGRGQAAQRGAGGVRQTDAVLL